MTRITSTLLILAWTFHALPLRAQPRTPTEYEVKAAFLYNFAKYVQWPAGGSRRPFAIGVLGRDPFGRVLDDVMREQKLHGRTIIVRRSARLEDVAKCDLLFIAASERDRIRRIFELLGTAPVLTVSEFERFAERGGMINLTTRDDRIRFEVNPAALARARLKASSQLLRLATIIEDAAGER